MGVWEGKIDLFKKGKAQIAQTKHYMLGNRYIWLINPINQSIQNIAGSYIGFEISPIIEHLNSFYFHNKFHLLL